MTKASLKAVGRTFLIAFFGFLIPGMLGWLHGITEWATSEGQEPLPEFQTLAFLFIGAVAAGFIALCEWVVLFIEDTARRNRTPRT